MFKFDKRYILQDRKGKEKLNQAFSIYRRHLFL